MHRGREMGCGMMVAGGREYLFPTTEIVSKKDFFDYQGQIHRRLFDEITPPTSPRNRRTAPHDPHRLQGMPLLGVVRVDFIVTPEGKPYLIEINSIPA